MSVNQRAQLMQDALLHAQHTLNAYKRLELVQNNNAEIADSEKPLSEAEIVKRAVECGDCD